MITAGLTEVEERELITLLGRVKQPWSAPFYTALASKGRVSTTDFILVAPGDRILVTQRPLDDAFEPGYWHFPGTVVRATDTSDTDSLKRVGEKELKVGGLLLEKIMKARYLCRDYTSSRRGPEINHYFVRKITEAEAILLFSVGSFVTRDEFKTLQVLDHHRNIYMWERI